MTGRFNRRMMLGAGLASVAGLAACRGPAQTSSGGTGAGGGAGSKAKGTISYWDIWQSQSPWVDNEISLFQKANSGVTVKRTQQQTGAYTNLLTLGAKSGNLPDVRYVGGDPQLNVQVSDGWLAPLNDHLDDAFVHAMPPYSFVEGNNMFDGKIYSMPLSGNTDPGLFLFVNTKVFVDAGIVDDQGKARIPKTWAEVTDAAAKITAAGKGKVHGIGFGNSAFDLLSWWVQVFCQAESVTHGLVLDLRVGKYTMGSDQVLADFCQLLTQWKKKGYIFPSAMSIDDETARVQFARGAFGMTVGGAWNIPGWKSDGFTDYAMTTRIGQGATPKYFAYSAPGGATLVMNAKAADKESSAAWIKWLNGPDAGKRWSQEYANGISIYPAANDPAGAKDQNFKNYLQVIQGQTLPGPQPGVRNPDTAKVQPEAITPAAGDVLAGIYTGQLKDITAAFKDLEKHSNQNQAKAIAAAVKKGAKVSADDYVFDDWDPTKPYAYDNIDEYPKL